MQKKKKKKKEELKREVNMFIKECNTGTGSYVEGRELLRAGA